MFVGNGATELYGEDVREGLRCQEITLETDGF